MLILSIHGESKGSKGHVVGKSEHEASSRIGNHILSSVAS